MIERELLRLLYLESPAQAKKPCPDLEIRRL